MNHRPSRVLARINNKYHHPLCLLNNPHYLKFNHLLMLSKIEWKINLCKTHINKMIMLAMITKENPASTIKIEGRVSSIKHPRNTRSSHLSIKNNLRSIRNNHRNITEEVLVHLNITKVKVNTIRMVMTNGTTMINSTIMRIITTINITITMTTIMQTTITTTITIIIKDITTIMTIIITMDKIITIITHKIINMDMIKIEVKVNMVMEGMMVKTTTTNITTMQTMMQQIQTTMINNITITVLQTHTITIIMMLTITTTTINLDRVIITKTTIIITQQLVITITITIIMMINSQDNLTTTTHHKLIQQHQY